MIVLVVVTSDIIVLCMTSCGRMVEEAVPSRSLIKVGMS